MARKVVNCILIVDSGHERMRKFGDKEGRIVFEVQASLMLLACGGDSSCCCYDLTR